MCVDAQLFEDIGEQYVSSGVGAGSVMEGADQNDNAVLDAGELENATLTYVLPVYWEHDAVSKAAIVGLVSRCRV